MDKIKKKRFYNFVSVFSILGFIASTVLLLYPVISDRWNRYRDSKLITSYNASIEDTHSDNYDDILKKAVDYNEYLRRQNRNIVTDAEYEPDDYYETLLALPDSNMMGYVEIPKIDVTEPIYHYSTEISLGKGIGHIHGSSLPVGGENTHSVLTGHRGLPTQKFFSDLDKLQVGDKFYIHVLDKILVYRVYKVTTIVPTDVDLLFIEEGKDLVTLVTCTPYGINTHRLLVMGERVDEDVQKDDAGHVLTEEHSFVVDPSVWVFVGFFVFIFILFIGSFIRSVIEKRKVVKNDEV